MIVKDIRYIIKRIIIGVGIALILMLIKGTLFLNVSALEIYAHDFGSQLDVISSTNYQTYYNTNNYWSDWGNGYVHFAFSVMKNAGQNSVTAIVQPRSVFVSTGGASFICDIGSVNSQNSTYNDQVYSATCPVSFDSGNGLRTIYINFSDIQANDPSTYRVTFDGKVTFEKPSAYPSFSDSGIINNQNSNNQALINNQNTNTQSIINNQNSNNQALINNQNTNTQSIINNQNSNNQALINNQNANTQQQIESQKVCNETQIDKTSIVDDGHYLYTSGNIGNDANMGITDYYSITDTSTITILEQAQYSFCYYNQNKVLISCQRANTDVSIPFGSRFVRFSIYKTNNVPKAIIKTCKNGNQTISEQNQQLQDTLNDTSTTQADSDASGFFGNFSSNSHGLSGIISSPLRLIQSLSSSTCSPLSVPLPFVNANVSLPCMSTIYTTHFNTFLVLYRLITTGLIGYWVCVRLFSKVKDFQNPDNDRIEVLDL